MEEQKIVVRSTGFARLFLPSLLGVASYQLWTTFGEYGLKEWSLALTYPFMVLLAVFFVQTLRITFSEKGITSYWYVGIGPLKLWEQTQFNLLWSDVKFVYQPIATITVIHGVKNDGGRMKRRATALGLHTTSTGRALVFLGDHVNPELMDESAQKVIARYRDQLSA